MKSPMKFFDLDVDFADSDKYFELFERAAELPGGSYAAWGRLVLVLAEIYKHGFALKLTMARRGRLARDLNLTSEDLEAFLGAAVESGWFDARLFADGVLTSRGIQERFAKAVRRRRPRLTDEERSWWLLEAPESGDDGTVARTARKNPETACKSAEIVDKNPEIAAICRPEEEREEEREEEEEEEEGPVGDTQVASGPMPGPRPPSSSSTPPKGEPAQQPAAQAPPSPGCLATHAAAPPDCFLDVAGNPHRTMAGAVMASWSSKTGRASDSPEARSFCRQISALCPASCRAGPERARTCYAALIRACEAYDPTRAPSMAPLAKRILRDERG